LIYWIFKALLFAKEEPRVTALRIPVLWPGGLMPPPVPEEVGTPAVPEPPWPPPILIVVLAAEF